MSGLQETSDIKGDTLPLHNFGYFSSSCFDTLSSELCRALTPHKLKLLRSEAPIDCRINSVDLDNIKIQAMTVGPAVEVLPLDLEDFYIIHMPFQGQICLSSGGRDYVTRAGRAVILSPDNRIGALWEENSSALLMTIPRHYMHTRFENSYGFMPNRTLTFNPDLDLTSSGGSTWNRLWTYILTEIEDRDRSLPVDRWVNQISSLIVETLIESVTHNFSDAISGNRAFEEPEDIAQAEAFMYAKSPDRPNLSELAAHVGISPRTLSRLFVRYRGCSPMQRMRDICLDAARDDLLNRCGNVTEIALHWGFNELGQFSKLYRDRFGEKPSETLRLGLAHKRLSSA